MIPHFSSSSPYLRAKYRMTASTDRAWPRRLSVALYLQKSSQASLRVGICVSADMVRV